MNDNKITPKVIFDAVCTAILYSVGGPVLAILYCLGLEEEEKMTIESNKNKPVELVGNTTVKMANADLFKWPER